MSHVDQLVADYLKRLDEDLSDLPRAPRRDLLQEISDHIDESRSSLRTQSEAEIRTLLDGVGDPADIAAEAHERFGVQPKTEEVEELGRVLVALRRYGLGRRLIYFVVAVPLVFGILALIVSVIR